eukprot:9053905-Pyramimonas_sp.AAC.1
MPPKGASPMGPVTAGVLLTTPISAHPHALRGPKGSSTGCLSGRGRITDHAHFGTPLTRFAIP